MPPSLKAKLVGTPARRNSSQGLSSGERKPLHNDNDSTTINEEADGIEDERVKQWNGASSWHQNIAIRRRFLLQHAVALHSYGSSSSRTEHLIDKAAPRLEVDASIAVFPSLILLSFPGIGGLNERRKEIHMLTVASDLDVGKLGHVDELTNQVGRSGTTFAFSYWRLKKIINSPPVFDKWCRLFGYAVSAATSAPLFFDGGPWDAFFCLIFGTAVGILDMIASINPMFATIMGFSSACLVAFLSKCLISNLKGLGLCYIALTLGSLTQLLPTWVWACNGREFSLVGNRADATLLWPFNSTIMDKIHLLSASVSIQTTNLYHSQQPVGDGFLGYAVGSNILLMARFEQWPGMTLTALAGYVVSCFTDPRFSLSTSATISAFAIGITGNTYSYYTGELPLAMIISGINILVPGGIGVQAFANMLKENGTSGFGFVFEMVVAAMSLTIGLLFAKIATPIAMQTARPLNFH